MKTFIKNSFMFIPVVLILSIFSTGCKQKGCTDKNALNYNVAADADDGSCIYCKGEQSFVGTNSATITDNNGSSQHYGDVAIVTLNQYSQKYNSTQCGNSSCYIALQVQSLINLDTMMVTCQISSSLFSSFYLNIKVPPMGTVNENNITDVFGNCQSSISNYFVNAQVVSGFQYKH